MHTIALIQKIIQNEDAKMIGIDTISLANVIVEALKLGGGL